MEQLRVSGTVLALAPATEVAAASDEESHQHDGKDGGKPRAEACPMNIDEAESVIGLIQGDVVGFMGDGVLDGEGSLVFHGDGGGRSSGRGGEVPRDLLFHPVAFDDVFSGAEHERGHDVAIEVAGTGGVEEL